MIEAQTPTTHDAYVEKLKNRIDRWNAELAALEQKASAAGAEARDRYEAHMEIFRQKRKAVQDKFREIQSAGQDAWTDLKAGTESAWQELEDTFKKVKADFA